MLSNKFYYFKILTIFLIIVSFFTGFFLKENAAGGGPEFYLMEWPIIQSLKKDFLYTIKNYGLFHDYTMPFPHMLNAFLNPFSNDPASLQLFNTFICFGIFFILFAVVRKVFSNIPKIDTFLISSVILLLPMFRTSAFWGKQENYGWLFLIISFYFFFEIKKNLKNSPNKKDIINIIIFCLSSSLALYARQALFFFPISYLLYIFFNRANKKIIIISILSYIIFSIPGLFLMWLWGGVFHEVPGFEPHGSFLGGWINPIYVLKNLPILLSFFGFYLLPFLIIEFLNTNIRDFLNNYYKSFLFALLIFIFLSQINLLDYLGKYTIAGGAILKVNYLILKNNYFLLLFFSSIGFSLLMRLFAENIKNNFVILFPMIIVFCLPKNLFQEYVEPLILLLFFLTLKTNLHDIYFKKINLSHLIFLAYFIVYLLGSIYFKHFAFSTLQEWEIFLGVQ